MKSYSETGKELDGMVAAGRNVAELAAFIARESRKNPALLKVLGIVCKRWEELLSLENLRHWPEAHADVLATFFRCLPCQPQQTSMPCGKKELLLAQALQDETIPKPIRIHLWRGLVMDGYIFPCYQGTTWTVPMALYDHPAVRNWLCQTKQEGWEDLCCSDPHLFRNDILKFFKTDAEKKALEAIEKDSPSALLMPLSIEGRNLPAKFVQAALQQNAIKIITYLYCNQKGISKILSPRQLLFYVCANWNNDATIPFVTLLEKDNPGLVKGTVDAFGHDALWYTLYQRDRFNRATEAARRTMDPLDKTLIELGCDPDRKNPIGLSYNDLTV